MISSTLFRAKLIRLFIVLLLCAALSVPDGFCQDTEDSQIFIAGFNAFRSHDFATTIARMDEVLQKYPKTPLRDMTLFWLARAYFKSGNRQDAARTMSQFCREYPGSPLKGTAEAELLALTSDCGRNELIAASEPVHGKAAEGDSRAEQQRLEREKAEGKRIAAEKAKAAEAARLAAAKAEQERQARIRVEQERAATEKATEERLAREKAERERIAVEKANAAEAARRVAAKAAQERQARTKAEQERAATAKAEKIRREKALLREKAIAQYKAVIRNYPGSRAADTATAKLRELGVTPQQTSRMPIPEGEQTENEQIFKLEVAQFAAFDLTLPATPMTSDPAARLSIPFEITNKGNGNDSFDLVSGFPPDFSSSFAAAAAPDQAVTQTPALAPGESFKGLVHVTIPAASIDGLRIAYPIKAVSSFMSEVTQSGEIHLITTAPLLRAIVKTDQTLLVPGETLSYRVTVLNIGSTSAHNVSLRLGFPPQLEPLDQSAAAFRQEGRSALLLDDIRIKPGESREFTVAFRLRDDSLAKQEIVCRAELIDHKLKTGSTFVSNAATVKSIHGVKVRPVSERIVIIPGQTVTVPFVVTNTGNGRDTFKIAPDVKGAGDIVVFHDQNRDGVKQRNEPIISEIGPLEPKEEASIVMEIATPASAADKSEGSAGITFTSLGNESRSASGSSSLMYSRPVLHMAMTSGSERLRPGDVASFNLVITNRGSNLARTVELRSAWSEQLELVASEPASTSSENGKIFWKFRELGAGEKRSIKVSFRVRKGIGAGASIRVKNMLTYEDQVGNRY